MLKEQNWSGRMMAEFRRRKGGWSVALGGGITGVAGVGCWQWASQPSGSLVVDLQHSTLNASTGSIVAVGVAIAVPILALGFVVRKR
jgi:hypothetical protein